MHRARQADASVAQAQGLRASAARSSPRRANSAASVAGSVSTKLLPGTVTMGFGVSQFWQPMPNICHGFAGLGGRVFWGLQLLSTPSYLLFEDHCPLTLRGVLVCGRRDGCSVRGRMLSFTATAPATARPVNLVNMKLKEHVAEGASGASL